MPAVREFSTLRLVNGSAGDPVLYLDYPGGDNALLFDCGDNDRLTLGQLGDLEAAFITHHHIDHFVGFDRLLRANLDRDKTLHVFGPQRTIERIFARIHSYEHAFFPFQKLTLAVHELLPKVRRTAHFECRTRFAPAEVIEEPWKGRVCYETEHLQVEALAVDHTVPCLAYALVERKGYHLDPEKVAAGMLEPGPWVAEALKLLRDGADPGTALAIRGGTYPLRQLAEQYFTESAGARVAFVTDTFFSEDLRPQLAKLAKGAWRLYCDSFYARSEAANAAKHRHMMAHQAAELAKAAKVERLVLTHFAARYAGHYDKLVAEAAAVFPRTTAELD